MIELSRMIADECGIEGLRITKHGDYLDFSGNKLCNKLGMMEFFRMEERNLSESKNAIVKWVCSEIDSMKIDGIDTDKYNKKIDIASCIDRYDLKNFSGYTHASNGQEGFYTSSVVSNKNGAFVSYADYSIILEELIYLRNKEL